jgi:hypothetical protein
MSSPKSPTVAQPPHECFPVDTQSRLGAVSLALKGAQSIIAELTNGSDRIVPLVGILSLAQDEIDRLCDEAENLQEGEVKAA